MPQIKKIFFGLIFLLALIILHGLNLWPHYLVAKQNLPNYIFTQQDSWFDPWDINVYVAAIKWGQQGHFLLQNRYTTLEPKPSLVYPIYTLAGKFFPQQDSFLIFYALSFITGTALFLVIYFLLKKFFIHSEWQSLIIAFAINLAGGLGWLLINKTKSTDLYVTAFTFHSAWQRPHEALGIIFYLLNLINYFVYLKKLHLKNLIIGFLSSLLLIVFYPYYFFNISLIIISLIFWFQKSFQLKKFFSKNYQLMIVFLGTGIITIFYWWHLQQTGFNSIAEQQLPQINFINLLLGFGISLPLAIFYFYQHRQQLNQQEQFLIFWFVISLFCSFLPLGFSRFYLRALFFPLLTFIALQLKKTAINNRQLALLICNCLLLFLPLSNLYIFFARVNEIHNTKNNWVYIPIQIKETFQFLNQQNPSNVLSLYFLGNNIPAQTNHNVVFGHYLQTPNARKLETQIKKFYAQQLNNQEAQDFLKQYQANYVLVGPEEQINGQITYPFLTKVFANQLVTIYKW